MCCYVSSQDQCEGGMLLLAKAGREIQESANIQTFFSRLGLVLSPRDDKKIR